MNKKTVYCIICEREVSGEECFDISMVAEDNSPECFLPKDLIVGFSENMKQICCKCKYHPT